VARPPTANWIDEARAILDTVRLADKALSPASALPHGDQRKLEVALLMALDPQVYMFDEPTAGMSVDEVPVILDLIRALKTKRDRTILLVEHKDGRRARARRPHHRAAQRPARGRRRTRASDRVSRRATGLSRHGAGGGGRMSTLLELKGVHTHIGAYHILHGVDLDVREGEVTMLLGRNGAGKTTTLRTIMGLWQASQGTLTFRGESLAGRGTPEIAQRGIAYVPESMGIFTDLTVKENMVLAARAARRAEELDTARLEWIFGLFPALKKFWLYPAGKLSGGRSRCSPWRAPSSSRAR
jgi:ABC-type branched-subunit amino acid transport system ATPase component